MLSIKEVEQITGISKQNIRYYEKQGLITPGRNCENDYREYSREDVTRLKQIKLFRKLDFSIDDIRQMFTYQVTLENALAMQRAKLLQEQERLKDAASFCARIQEHELEELDASYYLKEMEEEEKKGSMFGEFWNDFKLVQDAEQARRFRFMPNNKCLNAREFTEALFEYADEQKCNLVITKEGMYPEFTIDGVEYTAYRFDMRYGTVVQCERKDQEEIMPKKLSLKKYRIYRALGGGSWLAWTIVGIALTSSIPIGIVIGILTSFVQERITKS